MIFVHEIERVDELIGCKLLTGRTDLRVFAVLTQSRKALFHPLNGPALKREPILLTLAVVALAFQPALLAAFELVFLLIAGMPFTPAFVAA